ncbi:MAG: hypothetical protein HFF00_04620 [Ruminiclostridium sp.]|jgi:hypothetical protein|nr:hypothetical protein [Ruminiclostridium sp.]
MRIDKSKFSPEELAQYTALVAKATVPEDEAGTTGDPAPEATPPDDAAQKGAQKNETLPAAAPPKDAPAAGGDSAPEDTQKSEIPPALAAALARMEQMEKSIEMKGLEELAKKYEPMGEKPAELAATLYGLKKSNTASYDAYLKLLDKNLELFEKSGLFGEIGKSGNRGGGSAVEKVNAVAAEFQKADPTMSHAAALAKAWEAHPELVQEYDAEYGVQ